MHVPGPVSQLTRREKLLAGLDTARSSGLEIGALASPMLRPPEACIRFVDHADTATLRAKYVADPGVALDDIVPIDAVWGDNTLAQCFPGERFDYVIASHVIEHVPDVIGWLGEIADILVPQGRLILAIPDRRYSFDLLRRETTLTDVIDAHLRGAKRPTPGQVFDSNANTVDHGHMAAWFAPPAAPPPHFVSRDWALVQARAAQAGTYIDGHCSVFTARSLLELLDGMLELDLLPYRVERFHVACVGSAEMSLVLRREPDGAAPEAARKPIQAMLRAGQDSEGLALDTPAVANPEIMALQRRVAALEQAVAAMQASTSWRLTRPGRLLAGGLRAVGGKGR